MPSGKLHWQLFPPFHSYTHTHTDTHTHRDTHTHTHTQTHTDTQCSPEVTLRHLASTDTPAFSLAGSSGLLKRWVWLALCDRSKRHWVGLLVECVCVCVSVCVCVCVCSCIRWLASIVSWCKFNVGLLGPKRAARTQVWTVDQPVNTKQTHQLLKTLFNVL